ncbi:transcription factor pcc1 like protein [Zymoseptoria brevis]|uniref:Transcription factor pcc1 like protein n=1 Tax=Zymoseptoria brevis TaxID=1047168 RepID=A0A0F4H0I6_9PEZI|nr:transcription factor pcc1 like protein [Zymoseptoria brevis]
MDEAAFPWALTVRIPFPSARLASVAIRTLSVDPELSPLVRRSFSLQGETVLRTDYRATTNRMLRVAVNGFFDSLGTVLHVMEDLDVDVVHHKGLETLDGAQGVQQGRTGTAA